MGLSDSSILLPEDVSAIPPMVCVCVCECEGAISIYVRLLSTPIASMRSHCTWSSFYNTNRSTGQNVYFSASIGNVMSDNQYCY